MKAQAKGLCILQRYVHIRVDYRIVQILSNSADEWMDSENVAYIHSRIWLSCQEEEMILKFSGKWDDLESITM